jgi:hypothetical protein
MYRCSNKSSQIDLFSATNTFLQGKALKTYEDVEKWHNQFRVQVTQRIDEQLFRPLFHDGFGAPNASIRIMVSMMVLKEARGWSDSELFEHCQYNLLVRSALGLMNMDDKTPVESTYYLLRKRIVNWEMEGNENLLEKVFSQVTKSQAAEFQINGKKIRMDSKLLGSNIAWYSRYELIHETIRKAYSYAKPQIDCIVSESDIQLLERISGESGDKVTYRSSRPELETKLSQLGSLIYTILNHMDNNPADAFQTLRRVFNEQYEVDKEVVTPRAKQEISAKSVQSPHDTDCHYRQKDDQQVKGYSINATETCDPDNKFDLVTSVLVDPASAADCNFLKPAIEATQEIVEQKPETVNADGAYHSVENQDYCKENDIDLIVGAIQGKPSRYDLSLDENGNLVVTDLETNTIIPCRKVETRKEDVEPKWAISVFDAIKSKYRYFTQKDIDTCLLRKSVAARSQTELNVRNNVEATIFQLGFHYPNAKTRYRGIIKHRMWANLRCLWINFVRIANFVATSSQDYVQEVSNQAISTCFFAKNAKKWLNIPRFFLFFEKIADKFVGNFFVSTNSPLLTKYMLK